MHARRIHRVRRRTTRFVLRQSFSAHPTVRYCRWRHSPRNTRVRGAVKETSSDTENYFRRDDVQGYFLRVCVCVYDSNRLLTDPKTMSTQECMGGVREQKHLYTCVAHGVCTISVRFDGIFCLSGYLYTVLHGNGNASRRFTRGGISTRG